LQNTVFIFDPVHTKMLNNQQKIEQSGEREPTIAQGRCKQYFIALINT
jgi:hypothetical protein